MGNVIKARSAIGRPESFVIRCSARTANGYASTRYAMEIAAERRHGEIPARRAGLMIRRYVLTRRTGKHKGSASQPGPPCPEKIRAFRPGTQAMPTKIEGRPMSSAAIRSDGQMVCCF
jgi:hypothetical protein